MTKDGIEYNLTITPYINCVDYGNMKVVYRFSSELYLNKFIETSDKKYNNKQLFKHKYTVDLSLLQHIDNYIKVEKRGFSLLFKSNDTGREKVVNTPEELNLKVLFEVL